MLRISLAVIHLLALGIGLGAVFARARSANRIGQSPHALQRTFFDVINGEVPDRHGWLTYVYEEEAALRTAGSTVAVTR